MTRRRLATYLLADVQDAVRRGSYWITRTASRGAMSLHLDEADIRECVLGLRSADFYKTMPSERLPGLHQDVYRIHYLGMAIYVKVQMSLEGESVIVSFKRDSGT
jgi:hypothetical protein